MLSGRKYLERGWCPSGGGGSGPGRAEAKWYTWLRNTTGLGQGRERRGFPQTQLCVDCELCWEWSKPGIIRGSDQVDRVVMRSGVGVI